MIYPAQPFSVVTILRTISAVDEVWNGDETCPWVKMFIVDKGLIAVYE